MNEIAQLLARPLPLGLMLVFFFVSLALCALFIARIESKHRRIQAQYRAEIDSLRGRGADLAGPYHYSSLRSANSSSWFGWMVALGLGAAVGAGLLVALRDSPSADLAALTKIKAPVERVEPPAIKLGAVLAEPVEPAPALERVKAAPKKAAAPMQVPVVPSLPSDSVAKAPVAQGDQAESEDEDIERMLRWERQRAAERRRLRRRVKSPQKAQAPKQARRQPARPAQENTAAVAPQKRSEPAAAPAGQAPTDSLDSAERAADALLQEAPKPKKRRKKLRLDQSGDPLAS